MSSLPPPLGPDDTWLKRFLRMLLDVEAARARGDVVISMPGVPEWPPIYNYGADGIRVELKGYLTPGAYMGWVLFIQWVALMVGVGAGFMSIGMFSEDPAWQQNGVLAFWVAVLCGFVLACSGREFFRELVIRKLGGKRTTVFITPDTVKIRGGAEKYMMELNRAGFPLKTSLQAHTGGFGGSPTTAWRNGIYQQSYFVVITMGVMIAHVAEVYDYLWAQRVVAGIELAEILSQARAKAAGARSGWEEPEED